MVYVSSIYMYVVFCSGCGHAADEDGWLAVNG